MARPEPKPKSFMAPRYNPYAHRVRASPASSALIFQDVSANYLQIAQGNSIESDSNDSDDLKETRRRSWSREQKLGAVNYASITYITTKDGSIELISKHAAANNVGCTPKMLRNWTKNYNKIKASPKGSRRTDCTQPAQEPRMEVQLYNLFIEKCSIGRQVDRR
jgi:transposase-like protein